MDDKLTPVEIARQLGVTPVTVRNWIRDGDLKAFRIGGRIYVRPADLEAYLSRPVYPTDNEAAAGRDNPAS